MTAGTVENDLGLRVETARRTAHEFVRDTLRQAILCGEIAGGTRLVQADIAEQLSVSTTPVREALRDLATEGLIQLDAHRGAEVHQLDLDEVAEIYDLRILLEPEAMRRAARAIGSEQLRRAQALDEEMRGAEDAGVWADLNRRFHGVLAEAIDAPRLTGLLRGLRDSAAPYVGQSARAWDADQLEAANREHGELLAALREGDGERAAAITVEHLEATVKALSHSARQAAGT